MINLKKAGLLALSCMTVFSLCACFDDVASTSNDRSYNSDAYDDYEDYEDEDYDYDDEDYDDEYDNEDYDEDYDSEYDDDEDVSSNNEGGYDPILAPLVEGSWEYDDNVYVVGQSIVFNGDGTYSIYGQGGDEGNYEEGPYDYDGETVTLTLTDGSKKTLTLKREGVLVDWEGVEIYDRNIISYGEEADSDEDGYLREISYLWIYKSVHASGNYDEYFGFNKDYTWFYTEDDGETYSEEGTFEINGNGTIVLHFDSGKPDYQFLYDNENGCLIDEDKEELMIYGPIDN